MRVAARRLSQKIPGGNFTYMPCPHFQPGKTSLANPACLLLLTLFLYTAIMYCHIEAKAIILPLPVETKPWTFVHLVPLFWECFSITWGYGLETEPTHTIIISKQQGVYYGCPFNGAFNLPGPHGWFDGTSLCPALLPVVYLCLSLNRVGWGLCYLFSRMS